MSNTHPRSQRNDSNPECPTGPNGTHDRYSDGTCAYCRHTPNKAPLRPSEVASAFREGERAAYRRVLAFLTDLPCDEASDGDQSMNRGRGVAYATQEIQRAVLSLAQDGGVDL